MQIGVSRVEHHRLPDCSDGIHRLVVASIEETAEKYKIPKAFIGLILLPLVARIVYIVQTWCQSGLML